MASKFQSVLDASTLDARGDHLAFCQRQRLITPFRFGLSLLASMAAKPVRSIADLPRDVNALWDLKVTYKACYKQLVKASGAEFLRPSLAALMGKLPLKVLGFQPGEACSEFTRLIIQDGSSFAVHDALCHVCPGRFHAVKPAAVELHCTLEGLGDAPLTIVLSPDPDAEHDYRPDPASRTGALFLADRGSLDLSYLRDVARHGGCCIVRAKDGLNPRVIDAFREDGTRVKSCQDRALQASIAKGPKKQRTAWAVEWLIDRHPFRFRLIGSWHKEQRCFVYLLTNLDQSRYPIEKICLGYKLRWQVARLLKEWKSHSN